MAAKAVDAPKRVRCSQLYVAFILLYYFSCDKSIGVQAVGKPFAPVTKSDGHRSLGRHAVWQPPAQEDAGATQTKPLTGVLWLQQQLQQVLPTWYSTLPVTQASQVKTFRQHLPGRSLSQLGGGNSTIPPTEPRADPVPSPTAPSPATSPPITSPPSGSRSPTPADTPPPPPSPTTPDPAATSPPAPTPAPAQPTESSPPLPASSPTDTSGFNSPTPAPESVSSPSTTLSDSVTLADSPLPSSEALEPEVNASTTRTGSVMVDPVTLVPTGIAMGDNITNSTGDANQENENEGDDKWRLIISIVVPALTGIAATITIAYTGWKWWHKRQATAARQRMVNSAGAYTPTATSTAYNHSSSRADAGSFYAGGVKPLNADL